jgi:hypothetical protein
MSFDHVPGLKASHALFRNYGSETEEDREQPYLKLDIDLTTRQKRGNIS